MQGAEDNVVTPLEQGNLDEAAVDEKERVLLEFVRLLTESPAKTTDSDIQRLREAGWNDLEIAEAVYVTALFAFFNRVADAFGLDDSEQNTPPAEFE